jgi:hypothetical protein
MRSAEPVIAPSSRWADVALAVALLASLAMLGPALAHGFELPNKITLSREEYFIVQQIYGGWDKFALVLLVQVLALAAALWMARRQRAVVRPLVVTFACVVAAQVLFWSYTFPANAATANWTVQTRDWERLRRDWEYSHLAGAILQLFAVLSLITALVQRALLLSRAPRG